MATKHSFNFADFPFLIGLLKLKYQLQERVFCRHSSFTTVFHRAQVYRHADVHECNSTVDPFLFYFFAPSERRHSLDHMRPIEDHLRCGGRK